jgi:hypothetical protein
MWKSEDRIRLKSLTVCGAVGKGCSSTGYWIDGKSVFI